METSNEVQPIDMTLTEIPAAVDAKRCASCDKAFKIGDKVAIETNTEKRFHFKCFGKRQSVFVGVHCEKDDKLSSVDRIRLAARLKKIKRQVKKAGIKTKARRF